MVDQGLAIGGKPLKDHMEAIDHYEAIRYVQALPRQGTALTEMDVRTLHDSCREALGTRRSPGANADQGRYLS